MLAACDPHCYVSVISEVLSCMNLGRYCQVSQLLVRMHSQNI